MESAAELSSGRCRQSKNQVHVSRSENWLVSSHRWWSGWARSPDSPRRGKAGLQHHLAAHPVVLPSRRSTSRPSRTVYTTTPLRPIWSLPTRTGPEHVQPSPNPPATGGITSPKEVVNDCNGFFTTPGPLQLQYSQTVLLDFGGLSSPHVTVATLHKQG